MCPPGPTYTTYLTQLPSNAFLRHTRKCQQNRTTRPRRIRRRRHPTAQRRMEQIKDMSFLVRWSGYDSSHDSWEPWTALRRVDKIHAYLRRHGQESKFPRTLT
jgi:Chromo (CHRromatin Organisation MOdifier) domain